MTVNTAPERARRLVGRVVEALEEDYSIQHVANCQCEQDVSMEGKGRGVLTHLCSNI